MSWWTETRIDAVLDDTFIYQQLQSQQHLLETSPAFGDGLTDDTYLEWILKRARKLFLILVDVGIPDQIFRMIDESYDDDDLPFDRDAINQLQFSSPRDDGVNDKFHNTQFNFLIRDLQKGDHIDYENHETIPIDVVKDRTSITTKTASLEKKVSEKVVLSSGAVYTRRRVSFDKPPLNLGREELLDDIDFMKAHSHRHAVSVFASYTFENTGYALFAPPLDLTLKTFLSDQPSQFKSLEKLARREVIINWPHCLSSAISFLHDAGQTHSEIRPSNIFIDPSNWSIILGPFGSLEVFQLPKKTGDNESYNYAPPEQWVSSAVWQQTATAHKVNYSGARTTRKINPGSESSSPKSPVSPLKPVLQPTWQKAPSTSTILYSGARTRHAKTSSRRKSDETQVINGVRTDGNLSSAASVTSSTSSGSKYFGSSRKKDSFLSTSSMMTGTSAITGTSSSSSEGWKVANNARKKDSIVSSTASVITASSSSSSGSRSGSRPTTAISVPKAAQPSPVAIPMDQVKSTLVSAFTVNEGANPMSMDIFALGAVTLDILTHLMSRKISSFTHHRAKKNVSAGRGGAIADASFHANLGQVSSWIKQLDKEARKKAKEKQIYRGIPPILEVAENMLSKDPTMRPAIQEVEGSFFDSVTTSGGFYHCGASQTGMEHAPSGPRSPQSQRTLSPNNHFIGNYLHDQTSVRLSLDTIDSGDDDEQVSTASSRYDEPDTAQDHGRRENPGWPLPAGPDKTDGILYRMKGVNIGARVIK
ncbi:MAG: hypothetical protein M1834_008765 [Cirrosporium novae-zelandiae]|nr:MAG: hypothetical protein M1834_008765 [Cirrosporium novae-zelandiae]